MNLNFVLAAQVILGGQFQYLRTVDWAKGLVIEHCIIGETFFFTSSPPLLGAFRTMKKILCFFILNRLFLNNVKVESFV